jgi:hypothetical protein
LWVARQPLFDPRHPNEHQPDLAAVIDIAHLLDSRHFQAVGLIDQDEFCPIGWRPRPRGVIRRVRIPNR